MKASQLTIGQRVLNLGNGIALEVTGITVTDSVVTLEGVQGNEDGTVEDVTIEVNPNAHVELWDERIDLDCEGEATFEEDEVIVTASRGEWRKSGRGKYEGYGFVWDVTIWVGVQRFTTFVTSAISNPVLALQANLEEIFDRANLVQVLNDLISE